MWLQMYGRRARGLAGLCRRATARRSLCSVQPPRNGMEQLYNRIKLTGPITVASYMKECLLHPLTGYYMQKDVFGAKGDFTTSPEISQIFGELLAVWVLADWMVAGEPRECQLIELGPGRGTLLKDMMRVFGQFSSILGALSVHLVEASPAMSRIQRAALTGGSQEQSKVESVFEEMPYKTATLDNGVTVSWYQKLEDVPTGYCYIVAHEFFDALPVHQFQRTPSGWREVLVDVDPQETDRETLRFVLAPGHTPASAAYSSLLPAGSSGQRGDHTPASAAYSSLLPAGSSGQRGGHTPASAAYSSLLPAGSSGQRGGHTPASAAYSSLLPAGSSGQRGGHTPASAAYSSLLPAGSSGQRGEKREKGKEGEREGGEAEVCPEGLLVAKEVGRRVVGGGGAALIADYGDETVKKHTLRGFKGHQLHDVLTEPGSADLTADVDFGALSRAAMGEGAGCVGPMTQNEFLHKMGIRQRMQALLEKAGPSEAKQLLSGYEMLTSPEQMGQRFKFLTITSSSSHIPTPFTGVESFPTHPVVDNEEL